MTITMPSQCGPEMAGVVHLDPFDKGGITTGAAIITSHLHPHDTYHSPSRSPIIVVGQARMPGRDPAIHTHLPSPSTSPLDERPVGRQRSSSSAISRIPSDHHHHAHGPVAGSQLSSRRVSTPDGPISRLLRRVSMSTDPPERHDVEARASAGDSAIEHDE